jgi:hypothetical protein
LPRMAAAEVGMRDNSIMVTHDAAAALLKFTTPQWIAEIAPIGAQTHPVHIGSTGLDRKERLR